MNPQSNHPGAPASGPGALSYARTIADLPGPTPKPWVGNMFQMNLRQSHLSLMQWIREYGPIFRFQIMSRNVVVVSDPAVVANLMRERPDGFRRNEGGTRIMTELKIAGVVTAEGEAWRKQRKLVMRSLNAEVVRNFFPIMVQMTERMFTRWKTALEQGKRVDLHRDLKAMALDTIVAVAMGVDIDAMNNEGNQLQRDIDCLFQALGRRNAALFPLWRYFRLPADKAADKSAARVEQAVAGFIKNTRERMKQQPGLYQKPGNMLEAMIAASEDEGSDFTDQEMIDNAITSVVGGEDTTANSIAWLINFLVDHPEASARLAEEADAVIGDDTLVRDWDQMARFPWIDASHNESQRLKSVAPAMALKSNKDCVILDTFIPKDTTIFISTVAAGIDPEHFPQPELFQPERWINPPPGSDDPTRKLYPFGGGARLCPGRFLALTEIKMVVSMLMHNFELEFDPGAPPVKELMNFFMVPSAVPVRLKLRARQAPRPE